MKSDLSSAFLFCGIYLGVLFTTSSLIPLNVWTAAFPGALSTTVCLILAALASRVTPAQLGSFRPLSAAFIGLFLFAAQSRLTEPLPGFLREPVDLPGAFFSMVLLGPLCEEAFFRGLLLDRFGGNARAVVLQAVFFAVSHFSLTGLPFAFTGGLLLGFIAISTRGILSAFVAHATLNAIVISQRILWPETIPLWIIALCFACGLFGIWRFRKT